MKNFITVLLCEVGLRSLLVRYHKSRLLYALADMKRFGTETAMPVWCSQRFRRHHEALRRLGFVEQREFTLQQLADGYWSCAASGRRVIVTAPPSQMCEWQGFLLEYDQVV
jgi:hypothetical protein